MEFMASFEDREFLQKEDFQIIKEESLMVKVFGRLISFSKICRMYG